MHQYKFRLKMASTKNRVVIHKQFLKGLCRKQPHLNRHAKIKKASTEEIRSICELCVNLQRGVIPISKQRLVKLKAFKKDIKRISLKTPSVKKKREYLIQRGDGFLPLLAPLIAIVAERWLRD